MINGDGICYTSFEQLSNVFTLLNMRIACIYVYACVDVIVILGLKHNWVCECVLRILIDVGWSAYGGVNKIYLENSIFKISMDYGSWRGFWRLEDLEAQNKISWGWGKSRIRSQFDFGQLFDQKVNLRSKDEFFYIIF